MGPNRSDQVTLPGDENIIQASCINRLRVIYQHNHLVIHKKVTYKYRRRIYQTSLFVFIIIILKLLTEYINIKFTFKHIIEDFLIELRIPTSESFNWI